MGKRELVLVVVFVVLGGAVYQFTAPPPPPGSEGFSVRAVLRNIHRGVQGPRETATAESTQTSAVPASVNELRVSVPRMSDIAITGEDRPDVLASLHVTGRGFDSSEATASAHGPRLKVETSGNAVVVSLDTVG